MLVEDLEKQAEGTFLKTIIDGWYEQKKGTLLAFKKVIDDGVEPINHELILTAALFHPLDISDKNVGIRWGFVNINNQEVIAYQSDGQIYILRLTHNNALLTYFQATRYNFFGGNGLTSFHNRQSVILSRIRKN